MARIINFNAGPAALPEPALLRAREELLDFAGSGMSVMEHSHRGKEYEAVHNEAIALLRELLGVGKDFHVLFLQGGATQQFAMTAMSWLEKGKSADYVINGAWGEKAIGEAKAWAAMIDARTRVAGTSGEGEGKEKSYTRVAAKVEGDPAAAYIHYTSNETIHGVQYHTLPTAKVPLVCDMSSDFLWRKLDVSPFSMVYAGAQKNIGPSGVVVALVRDDFLQKSRKDLPKIFQYRYHAENNSLANTPPTFGIYLVRNVLSWVKQSGGLAKIEEWNREKANTLYGAIDQNKGFFRCPVEQASRSVMNVVFRLPSEALEEKFVSEAKKAGMVGLKGHRSVGGIRVSLYNAVTVAWVKTLVDFMGAFAKANG
jgi:phosphoserine aminotransferase